MSSLDQHDVKAPHQPGGQAPEAGSPPEPGLGWDDQSEFVTSRPAGFRILRAVAAVVILAFIGYVVYTTGRNWLAGQIDPAGEPGAPVVVTVPSGATTDDIGSILSEKGIIPNSTFFRYYAQWRDQGNFQAGEYTFAENMSADEAIEVLLGGPRQIEYGEFELTCDCNSLPVCCERHEIRTDRHPTTGVDLVEKLTRDRIDDLQRRTCWPDLQISEPAVFCKRELRGRGIVRIGDGSTRSFANDDLRTKRSGGVTTVRTHGEPTCVA